MKHRKKPVIVEAFQFKGGLYDKGKFCVPQWAIEAYDNDIIIYDVDIDEYFIKTLRGVRHLQTYAYIVKDETGNIYPVRPDTFEQTYERVKE